MQIRTCRARFTLSVLLGLAFAASAWASVPVPVSPGGGEGFSGVDSACPTFSWSGAGAVTGYELVAYEVSPEATGPVSRPVLEGEPALRATIPAGALSWTPPAESCFEIGGAYAWTVRKIGDAGPGEWSQPALFRVRVDSVLDQIGGALERALSRYLDERGVELEPDGSLGALLSEEIAGGTVEASPAAPPVERMIYRGGKRVPESAPIPRGVFTEDVELWLEENGSGPADKVQLVFATPEFDGDPVFGDAWSIIVDAQDSGSADDGTMFISTPDFTDVAQFFTDGSVVLSELRELTLRRLSSPPGPCTSLQEGTFYWDEQANSLCVCDGSTWEPIDSDSMVTCA